jgi:Tat protein translocase TatB subunit
VLLLILDSLGSTELLFILVMALIFFGPRKLPQISRSLGKSIAEFRKASDDFKRTWEREVALEEPQNESDIEPPRLSENNSIIGAGNDQSPMVEAVSAERIVPRQTTPVATDATSIATAERGSTDATVHSEPLRKRDWL